MFPLKNPGWLACPGTPIFPRNCGSIESLKSKADAENHRMTPIDEPCSPTSTPKTASAVASGHARGKGTCCGSEEDRNGLAHLRRPGHAKIYPTRSERDGKDRERVLWELSGLEESRGGCSSTFYFYIFIFLNT